MDINRIVNLRFVCMAVIVVGHYKIGKRYDLLLFIHCYDTKLSFCNLIHLYKLGRRGKCCHTSDVKSLFESADLQKKFFSFFLELSVPP